MEWGAVTVYIAGEEKDGTFKQNEFWRRYMDLQIRECMMKDYGAIYELNRKEMGYDYPLDLTESKLKQLLGSGRDKIFVAVMENQVVGYIHANDYDLIYAPPMKNIMGIAVSGD